MRIRDSYHRIILLLVTAILLLNATDIDRSARANAAQVTFTKHIAATAYNSGHLVWYENLLHTGACPVPNAGWQEVGTGSASHGGISNTGGVIGGASIAVASDGTPYVAWSDDSSGNDEIYVRRWNGSDWEEVGFGSASSGGISKNSGSSLRPRIAVAPDNTPFVAWSDNTSGRIQIYIRRWNGSDWEEVGTGSASGGGVSSTGCNSDSSGNKLAFAPDGTLYAIWSDDCGSPEIYVRRWNGSTWEEAGVGSANGGGISNTPGRYSYDPSIIVGSGNVPYAVWHDNGVFEGQFDIYARRFEDNTWQEVGTGSASGSGTISPPDGWSRYPWVAVAPGGAPYVAWIDRTTGRWQIYIRRWSGSAWEEVGTGSASGGGISDSNGDTHRPSIPIALDGTPYVVWEDNGSGDLEIYVRRWNGRDWEEVGAGSASDGGISDNSGASAGPSAAFAPDDTLYVAWSDDSSGNHEIYVRRYVPNSDPVVTVNQASVTVDEGQTATNSGTVSDPDNDTVILSASVGTVINNGDGTWFYSYTPSDGPAESQTVTITGTDSNGAATSITFELVVNNVAPTATFNASAEVDEGDDINLSLSDPHDPSSDDTATGFEYAFDCGDGGGYGSWSSSSSAVCPTSDNGTRTVKGKIGDKDGGEIEYTAEVTMNNVAPVVTVNIDSQTIQYSDYICDVTFTATDVLTDPLTPSWSALPDSLIVTDNGCTDDGLWQECSWTLSGTMDEPVGLYTIEVTVTDDDGGSGPADTTITVQHEDADIWLDVNNPIAVQVDSPGGDSPAFSLIAYVQETYPDDADCGPDPGDITNAQVEMTLSAVGPGNSPTVLCTPVGVVSADDYDGILEVRCDLYDVDINTYHVQATVVGDYYTSGIGEDALVVFDPSLGFTTGGGWFYWPGTDEKTNFGYTIKYNNKGTKVQGSLLLIRHMGPDTKYRVKSNALDGLALGESTDPPFGWASFSGKCTYKDKDWEESEGNHGFLVYVEDYGEPGRGVDQFWIEVYDKGGNVIDVMSMGRPADDHTETLSGGNIVVPH